MDLAIIGGGLSGTLLAYYLLREDWDPVTVFFSMSGKHLLFFMLLLPAFAFSQEKETEYTEQLWLGYFNQTRLTHRSGIWLDVHYRLNDNFIQKPVVSLFRGAYIFYLADKTRLAAGYAYGTQYAQDENAPNVPEHRLWQQIQWFEKKKWFSTMQWIRLEERFRATVVDNELTSDYHFNYRIRYAVGFTIPLKGKEVVAHTPFLFINNELMINFGSEIVNNYFDQNRFFVGVGYQFTPQLNAQIGYLNVFQQLPAYNTYRHIDAIRLFVFHNLDFRPNDQ